jgi:ComF family protein
MCMLLARAITPLLDAVAPRCCAGCRQPGFALCPVCVAALEQGSSPASGDGIQAAYRYAGAVAALIQSAKYGDARTALRQCCEQAASRINLAPSSLLVPIPLGRRRARQRGFNQAGVLAQALAQRWGCLVGDELIRVRDTRPQVGQSRSDREANLGGAFHWIGSNLAGRSVVIVDDVCTTQSTIKAAAMALKRGGAGQIRAVVLARRL